MKLEESYVSIGLVGNVIVPKYVLEELGIELTKPLEPNDVPEIRLDYKTFQELLKHKVVGGTYHSNDFKNCRAVLYEKTEIQKHRV